MQRRNSLVKVWPLAGGIRGMDANQTPVDLVPGKPGWLTEARFEELSAEGKVMKMAGARFQDLHAAKEAYETRHMQVATPPMPPVGPEEPADPEEKKTHQPAKKKVVPRKKATYRRRDMKAEKLD